MQFLSKKFHRKMNLIKSGTIINCKQLNTNKMKKVISIILAIGIIAYSVISEINAHKQAFINKIGYYPKKEKVIEVKQVDYGTYEVSEKTIYVK